MEPGSRRDGKERGMEPKTVVVYTKDWCSYCWRIRHLLKRKGYAFEKST